jgi:O-antigen/teichoic acid export membrane protein
LTFRRGILSTFIAKVAVAILGLVMVILVSRNLGADGRGQIGLFMSSVALLQLFNDFGNSTAIINLSYQLPNRKLWASSIAWILLICFLSYPVLLFFDNLPFVYLIPPAAFLYSAINLNQMLLMGNRRVMQRNISLIVMPALIIPGFLILFHFGNLDISSYPTALFIALITSLLISRIMLGKVLGSPTRKFVFEKAILKQGFWVQSAHTLQFLNYRLNFFLVAFIIGDAALGIYNNAIILCESIWILGHSIGQMQHLKILNSADPLEHIKLSKKLIGVNFLGSLVLCICLYLVPNGVWTYLFSSDFESMRSLFIYLIPGVLCFSVTNIINHYLHAKNQFKKILACNGIGLLVGLSTALLLIPEYGLEGASISWSAGLATSMICGIVLFLRQKHEISVQA